MSAAFQTDPDASLAGATATAEQFLTFEIGDELFALPILSVQEIRGWEKVSQIPRTDAQILGVINLRGSVVPVLDVRTRLGIEPREVTPTTVLIVVRLEAEDHSSATVGCVVDAVSDVVSIRLQDLRPAPSTCGSLDSHFIRGVATIDTRLVLVLDLSLLISQS